MSLRAVFRDLCPPVIPKLVRRLRRSSGETLPDGTILFAGNYQSWEDAEQASTGYADQEILSKTRAALLKVKRGDAAFERDSVTFQVMEHRFPLLAGLLRAAIASEGRLNIVDFGGALGGTYFQCRQFLSGVRELRWSIVEQPDHVTCGQAEFSDEHLRFYRSIEDCLQKERPNVLLTSSVVQYLPNPYAALEDLLRRGFDHVIIDRVPFLLRNQDRLTVQTVPESIYRAKYPAWFFNESRFRQTLTDAGYFLVADFAGLDTCSPADETACYKGFILEKRPSRGGSGV